MGEKIRQADLIGRVQPPNRTRDTGQRKRPRKQPDEPPAEDRESRHRDGPSHQVDEYA